MQIPPRELTPEQRQEYIRAVIDYLQPGQIVSVYDFKNTRPLEYQVITVNRRPNAKNFKGVRYPTGKSEQDVALTLVMLPTTAANEEMFRRFTPPKEILDVPKLSVDDYRREILQRISSGQTVYIYNPRQSAIVPMVVQDVNRRQGAANFKGADPTSGVVFNVPLVSVYQEDIRGPGIPANIIEKFQQEGAKQFTHPKLATRTATPRAASPPRIPIRTVRLFYGHQVQLEPLVQ